MLPAARPRHAPVPLDRAPPEVVWDALHEVKLTGLPLTVVLGAARFLPVLLSGQGLGQLHDRPFLDVLPVPLLSSEEPQSVVFGGALQAWRLTGGEEPPELDAAGAAGLRGARLGEGGDGLPAHSARPRHGAELGDAGGGDRRRDPAAVRASTGCSCGRAAPRSAGRC